MLTEVAVAKAVAAAIAAEDATDEEEEQPEFYEGAEVMFVNLQACKHLNDALGKVLNWIPAAGRWRVILLTGIEKGETKHAKPENMFLANETKTDVKPDVPMPAACGEEQLDDTDDEGIGKEGSMETRATPRALTKKKDINKQVKRLERPVPEAVAWKKDDPPIHKGIAPDVLLKQCCVYAYGVLQKELRKNKNEPSIRWDKKFLDGLSKVAKERPNPRVGKKQQRSAKNKTQHRSRILAAQLFGIHERTLQHWNTDARRGTVRAPMTRGVRAFDLTSYMEQYKEVLAWAGHIEAIAKRNGVGLTVRHSAWQR